VSGWLASRAIVAAAPQHVTIADRSTRIDIRLEHSFPAEALCRAMQQGLQAFAALTGEDTSALGEQLAAAGLIEAAPSQLDRVPGTIPLADALCLEDRGLTRGCVIYTADEAFWPGSDPHLARAGFRLFVSRLADIVRCAVYAPLAAGRDVRIVGDEPSAAALGDARRSVTDRGEPCVIDLRSGEITGLLRDASDMWTGRGLRLSVAQRLWEQAWHISPERSMTCVSGICAFSNLSAMPILGDVAGSAELDFETVGGVDGDPRLAEAKCLAEGAERFSAGDVDLSRIRYDPASALPGRWLDPRQVIAYSAAQRHRLGLSEFDAEVPEWWVPGESHDGPVWIPAALVYYPFAAAPPWLAPIAVSSNGVAAYPTAPGALRRAWLELVERDAYQRARLTGKVNPPPRIRSSGLPDEARDMVDFLARHAKVTILLLPSPAEIPVVLVRADTDRGIASGAAAATDIGQAAVKAATEAYLQVISPILHEITPESVQTPLDHGALYNMPGWREELDWMLRGIVVDPAEVCASPAAGPGPRACWYELSPRLSGLHVMRVIDPDLIPLTFGYDSDPAGREDVRALLRISGHPADQPLKPHAFA
jgi:hypothetical protein